MSNFKNVGPCQACGSAAEKKQAWSTYNVFGTDYQVYQCQACGTYSSSPNPSDETLIQLYSNFPYEWYQDHFPVKVKDAETRVAEYAPILGESVLDYGGGMGYFSQVCRTKGKRSVTFDPFAKKVPPEAEGTWDTLVLLHVVEHSNNLDALMTDIKSRLNKKGKLILAVPNADGVGYQKLGDAWVWAQPPLIHIHHLSRKGMEALLTRHGFKILSVKSKERWDANTVSDVYMNKFTRRFDQMWGAHKSPTKRKMIAGFNSFKRQVENTVSKIFSSEKELDLAELEIIAELQ